MTQNNLSPLKLSSKMITRMAAIQILYIHVMYEQNIEDARDFIVKYLSDIYGFKKHLQIDKEIYITFKINTDMLDSIINNYHKDYQVNHDLIKSFLHISYIKLSDLILLSFHTALAELKYLDTPKPIIMTSYVDIVSSFGFSTAEVNFFNATLESIIESEPKINTKSTKEPYEKYEKHAQKLSSEYTLESTPKSTIDS